MQFDIYTCPKLDWRSETTTDFDGFSISLLVSTAVLTVAPRVCKSWPFQGCKAWGQHDVRNLHVVWSKSIAGSLGMILHMGNCSRLVTSAVVAEQFLILIRMDGFKSHHPPSLDPRLPKAELWDWIIDIFPARMTIEAFTWVKNEVRRWHFLGTEDRGGEFSNV